MASVLRRLLKKSKPKGDDCKSIASVNGDSSGTMNNCTNCNCNGTASSNGEQLSESTLGSHERGFCRSSPSNNRCKSDSDLTKSEAVDMRGIASDDSSIDGVNEKPPSAATASDLVDCTIDDSIVVENNHKSRKSGSSKGKKDVVQGTKSSKSQMVGGTDTMKQIQSVPNLKPEVRTKRLMKEYREVTTRVDRNLFTVELVEDSLYDWNVRLYKVDPESELYGDMMETGIPYILLNITFPDNFPFLPPFMRVVYPRIEGGFVLDGGAICMELLTPRGWSSAYSVEAIIMQFAASVVKGRGRMNKKCQEHFSRKEAESTFKKLVKTHERFGWVTPPQSEG